MSEIKTKKIECCEGKYHVFVDGKFYCMAPPNIECTQLRKDVGKFTRGEKKILYCIHHQNPCAKCREKFKNICDAVK